jgi:peptidyl-prolyl cis-trans isomerase D
MFDFVRKHTKIMMFIMFALTIPAFVLVGVDGYRSVDGGGEKVAEVGGQGITQVEWDAAHKVEADRLRSSMPNIDPKMLDSSEARYVTLERMVRDRVMALAAQEAHLVTTDARLARELQQNQTIASLRKPDGSLDMERYRQLAGQQGLTPEGFEARVRNDLSVRQAESGVLASAFSTGAQADAALNAFFERRDVQLARFSAADYVKKVELSDADVEAFYQANQPMFQAPETANVEYLVLDMESVKKTIPINEADLKTYYEQNVGRLSGKEERRASHILFNAPKDMPASEREKAKSSASSLLEQLRKSPERFAELARNNSQDPGSAANGGDLDFFGRGAMVKPFEEAAFALKKGEISDLVESEFGFHIIKLTDINAPKQKSFEELRAGIESDLRTQQAQRKFAEAAETFSNSVYEQSDSLKPIAEKLKLEIKSANNVQRQPSPGQSGVLANAKLLSAVFNPDALEKKRNSEAVETAANQLVSARITEYFPARVLPLGEVKAQVRERLLATRSAELAKKDGQEKLTAWKSNPAQASLPASTVVARDQAKSIPPAALDAALRANTSSLPAWVGVDLGAQGYAVLRVNKVLERGAVPEVAAKQQRAQYAQWVAGAENQAYFQALKNQFKVKIKPPRPSEGAVVGSGASAQ